VSWRDLEISSDGTHHIRAGSAAYAKRFDEVLAFHAPGLAPVRLTSLAWHIDAQGDDAYPQRFERTFGFYDELAAVQLAGEWFHITRCGDPAYAQRFAWCGNFQEHRCAVRSPDGRYHHIDPSGVALYAARWRYVGDYRGGIAVVQSDAGLSTHIDRSGELLHARWFRDLDVFHKGFARARDDRGWTHVDRSGAPAYRRRFSMVEPFYNGQARVELDDGSVEIIDERGETIAMIREARVQNTRAPFAALSAELVGVWRTRTIAAAVELGVFDVLPGTTAEIAARCCVSERRLSRLLCALAELALVRAVGERWCVTERGGFLSRTSELTLADAALEYAGPLDARWTALSTAIRDEAWRPSDIFDEVSRSGARVRTHHRMLASYAKHDYANIARELGLCGDERVIDAGGGLGVLAAEVAQEFPAVRVAVLEREEVVAHAPASAPSVQFHPRDLFEPWRLEADVVLFARVLHDWDDADAVRLLRRAREALALGGRVVVLEMLLDEDRVAGALCDLHLLVATGGRERTAADFERLFHEAGLAVHAVRRATALTSIVSGGAR